MATAPPLYLNLSTGTSTRFATTDTMQAKTIAAFAVGDTASLFDNITTGGLTIGASLDGTGTVTIGSSATEVNIPGDLRIIGTEYVQTNETVSGDLTVSNNTTLGDAATDFIVLNGEVASDITFRTSTAARTITGDGTNGLTVTAGASTALTLTSPVAATWSTTAGALTLDGAGGVSVAGNAGEIDLTTTGIVDVNGASLDLDATAGVAVTAATTLDLDGATVTIDGSTSINIGSGAVYTDGTNVAVNQASFTDTDFALEVKALDTTTDTECILLTSNEGTPRSAGIEIGDGVPTHTVAAGTLYLRNAGGTAGSLYVAEDNAGTWAIVGTGSGNSLQAAYVVGPDISVTSGEGDLTFSVDTADFLVVDGANLENYIATDEANNQLELGSSVNTIGLLGEIDTNMTFETSGGAKTITGNGTNGLTVTAGASTALTLTSPVAATWSTTAGILDLDGAGGVTIEGNAGEIDLTTTGAVDVNGAAITVDASAGISLDAAAASNFTTSAGALTLTSAAAATWSTAAGLLGVTGAGGVTVTSTGGTLTLNGTGQLVDLNSAALDIDASGAVTIDSTAGVSIDGVGASNLTTDTGNLTLSATTSGDILMTVVSGAANDISMTAHGFTLTLNEDGTDANFASTNYISADTSIVAALRDLDAAVAGAGDTIVALPAGEAVGVISAGDALYVNASGQVVRSAADALASARFVGFAKDASVSVGTDMDVYTAGEVTVSTDLSANVNFAEGEYCYLDLSTGTSGGLIADDDLSGLAAGNVIMRVGIVTDVVNDLVVVQAGNPFTL